MDQGDEGARWRAVCGVERTRWLATKQAAEDRAIARGWASRGDGGKLFRHPWLKIEERCARPSAS